MKSQPGTTAGQGSTTMKRSRYSFIEGRVTGSLAALALLTSPAAGADPAALVENARCLICHHAEEQRVGPSWAAIAERYGDDSEALATLTARARSGGSGVWGPAPMPPVTDAQLDDAQLASVIGWILER
jgi:cytochrome c